MKVLQALILTATEPQRLERFVELDGLKVLSRWLDECQNESSVSASAHDNISHAILRLLTLLHLPIDVVRSHGLLAVCCGACFLTHAESRQLADALVTGWQAAEKAAEKAAAKVPTRDAPVVVVEDAVVVVGNVAASRDDAPAEIAHAGSSPEEISPDAGGVSGAVRKWNGYFPDPSFCDSRFERSASKM